MPEAEYRAEVDEHPVHLDDAPRKDAYRVRESGVKREPYERRYPPKPAIQEQEDEPQFEEQRGRAQKHQHVRRVVDDDRGLKVGQVCELVVSDGLERTAVEPLVPR